MFTYIISGDLFDMNAEINRLLADGWSLYGDTHINRSGKSYYQAMVKKNPEHKETPLTNTGEGVVAVPTAKIS